MIATSGTQARSRDANNSKNISKAGSTASAENPSLSRMTAAEMRTRTTTVTLATTGTERECSPPPSPSDHSAQKSESFSPECSHLLITVHLGRVSHLHVYSTYSPHLLITVYSIDCTQPHPSRCLSHHSAHLLPHLLITMCSTESLTPLCSAPSHKESLSPVCSPLLS